MEAYYGLTVEDFNVLKTLILESGDEALILEFGKNAFVNSNGIGSNPYYIHGNFFNYLQEAEYYEFSQYFANAELFYATPSMVAPYFG